MASVQVSRLIYFQLFEKFFQNGKKKVLFILWKEHFYGNLFTHCTIVGNYLNLRSRFDVVVIKILVIIITVNKIIMQVDLFLFCNKSKIYLHFKQIYAVEYKLFSLERAALRRSYIWRENTKNRSSSQKKIFSRI